MRFFSARNCSKETKCAYSYKQTKTKYIYKAVILPHIILPQIFNILTRHIQGLGALERKYIHTLLVQANPDVSHYEWPWFMCCHQDINHVNGKPAATTTTVARREISEPRRDGSSQPPEEKAKRKRKRSDSQCAVVQEQRSKNRYSFSGGWLRLHIVFD